jgi:hypothetical protein
MFTKVQDKILQEHSTKFGDVYCKVLAQWSDRDNTKIYLIEDDKKYVFIMNARPLSWIPKEILESCSELNFID